jgi:hypothetical protein
MPVVIVPTACAACAHFPQTCVSCGVNASRTWLIPANAAVEIALQVWARFQAFSGSGLVQAFTLALVRALASGGLNFGFRRGFGFRLVLLFQKFADALFQRRQIIRDAPATFCPFAVSSMPLTRSGAVSNRTRISAEKVSLSAF